MVDMSVSKDDDGEDGLQVWALRFVLGVTGLGWWMLFMTAIWFHTWLEKVSYPYHPFLLFFLYDMVANCSVVWVGDCIGNGVYHLLSPEKSPAVEGYCWNSWRLGYFGLKSKEQCIC